MAAVSASRVLSGEHDHQGCIDRALSRADSLCTERGVRFTPLRRQVLKLIWGNHEAVKAYDLLELLKPFDPSAKPATIYRALDFLLEQGFIHRIESLNAFIGCSDIGRQHELLLLICDRCHTVEERAAVAVMDAVAAEIAAAGFRVRYKAQEIHGLCAACASREPPERA